MNEHSVKFYDKAYSQWGSVLRGAETTLNGGRDIRVYRPKQGGPDDVLQWLPMRKGIADVHRRGEVSQASNNRLLAALARVDDSRTVAELTAGISATDQVERATRAGAAPLGKRSGLASCRQ